MRLRCLTLALLLAAPAAGAQVTETPLPFDTAGRVTVISPTLAARLRLAAPAWPVLGSFVDARLFTRSDSGYTLVVARGNGAFDRYALDAGGVAALRGDVQRALASGRRAGLGEQTTLSSDPAGNAFVRNQAALGIVLYGPAAAALLADSRRGDGARVAATELLVAGGTFFAAMGRRSLAPPVTTAQNILATHMAIRGAAIGDAIAYAAAGGREIHRPIGILAGALAGTVTGMISARRMTQAEAASAGFGADFLGATTVGVTGALGSFQSDRRASRVGAAATSAAMLLGYRLGPAYARRAPYTVTAGDVTALEASALLGAAIAATPLINADRPSARASFSLVTAGFLVGSVAGDRWLVRPVDHTRSDGALLWTGTIAGALVGAGVAAEGGAKDRTAWMIGTSGALLGVVATEAALRPAPGGWGILGGARASAADVSGVTSRAYRVEVHIDPLGAAFAATRTHGRFPVMRVSF